MEQNLSIARANLARIPLRSALNLLETQDFILAQDRSLKICYAPFDHVARKAKLVVVGITPGMTQAVNAFNAAAAALKKGASMEAALAEAKLTASFSGGVIRNNLVRMLDAIGVARHFGVATTAELFRPGSEQIHFTSALRYPVFVNGENYNGTPDMLAVPILRAMVETHLAEETALLPEALWLPLGPKAEKAVMHLVRMGKLDGKRVLSGMPHPSGANSERVNVFGGWKAPEQASRQTNAPALVASFNRLKTQISTL